MMSDEKLRRYPRNPESQFYRFFICMLFISVLYFIYPLRAFPQEYGLEFVGQPFLKDNRTKLELNPKDFYSFNGEFELSFFFRVRTEQPSTFGYVTRIIDNNENNIDIIYNSTESNSIQVVNGQNLTSRSLPDPDGSTYKNWTEIRLKFNLKERSLHFSTPDTLLVDTNININGKVKILFGANDFGPVKTTDVPTIDLKDIRIYQKGKCLHYFPLNEVEGNYAEDFYTKQKAVVQNPVWIKPKHLNWEKSFTTYLKGLNALCFDPVKEQIYIVGDEQLKIFSILEDEITTIDYSEKFIDLIRGSQVFFDTLTDRLLSYNLKIKDVFYFNFSEQKWEEISNAPNGSDRFWFHNKYYSSYDSTLYVFGGYGQHKYFNLVQQYSFINREWDTVHTIGEAFYPRMHAAIGYSADTLYIIGGFGSKTGNQILNPEHYTDLIAFSLKDRKFINKYEFEAPIEDIDFAHSMIINKNDQSYYLLATTIFEYETYLQLLKGNLANPALIKHGNKIPYLFDNENSYCDLFYSERGQKLIAATSLSDREQNETEINIYTISFPPYATEIENSENKLVRSNIIITFLVFLFAVTLLIIILRYIIKKVGSSKKHLSVIKENRENSQMQSYTVVPGDEVKKLFNSILFFGGFHFINKDGDDITKKFTPLLKELFLLIYLHSIKNKGISVPSLNELLWFSMDAKSAKNNRAVNIAKLKNLLSEIDSLTLTRKTSYWRIEFNDSIVFNDYWSCYKIFKKGKNHSKHDIEHLLFMVNKGSLLGNSSYEWLDEFKLDCSNQIIDYLIQFLESNDITSDPDLMIQIADAILIFDMMHEEAISLKCRALTTLGKHNLAKESYNKFVKDYSALYDEEYNKTFQEIIRE